MTREVGGDGERKGGMGGAKPLGDQDLDRLTQHSPRVTEHLLDLFVDQRDLALGLIINMPLVPIHDLLELRFGLFAGRDIADDPGEFLGAVDRHFASGQFDGERDAIVAKAEDLAPCDHFLLARRQIIVQVLVVFRVVGVGHEQFDVPGRVVARGGSRTCGSPPD
ncbi:MAG: hypothetical protein MRJ92_03190 [Nitrospira sp.]|nr:hypothetical protein [Nitrospira sp.]